MQAPVLLSEFATKFPDLSVPWQAAPIADPELVWLNESLVDELGLQQDWLRSHAGVSWLSGQELAPGSKPVAQVYAGHQFGHYSSRLGDGRALLLGEIKNTAGELHDIHLKGSGPTPFSRGGDGFAALGPMLREAIMGESMNALGIKTSRALAVIKTGRWLTRDGEIRPAAVLVRVAASHLRVGTFEFVRRTGDLDLLARLTDYALARHYPKQKQQRLEPSQPSVQLLKAVTAAQAELVANWMSVGFVHGVINTDNVTISGETLDYGPCAMLDTYDPTAVFSSIDQGGRYSYRNQPLAMQWNLARFAESLLPLLDADEKQAVKIAEATLSDFSFQYEQFFTAKMLERMGAMKNESENPAESLAGLLEKMRLAKLDFTAHLRELNDANPLYVARNHLVEEAVWAAEADDLTTFRELMEAIADPVRQRPGLEKFASPPPPGDPRLVTTCGT